jgi:hypothetical protein
MPEATSTDDSGVQIDLISGARMDGLASMAKRGCRPTKSRS